MIGTKISYYILQNLKSPQTLKNIIFIVLKEKFIVFLTFYIYIYIYIYKSGG